VIALVLLLALPPVTVESQEDGSAGSTHATAFAACEPARVWAVITDHRHFPQFVPHLKDLQVLQVSPDFERALQTVDAVVSTVRYALDYHFDRARWHIEYALAKDLPHDIASAHGAWQLAAAEGGTLIDYRTAVDVGKPVPGFIKRYLARNAATDLLEAVRLRACAPASPAH